MGLVHLSNSEDKIFVTYDLTHTSWSLAETHLYIGAEQEMPGANSGSPNLGKFTYHAVQDDANKKEFSFVIPIDEFEECIVIVARAVVQKDDESDRTETAFAFDSNNELPGSRWGWYMDYCLHECEDMTESEDGESPVNREVAKGSREFTP